MEIVQIQLAYGNKRPKKHTAVDFVSRYFFHFEMCSFTDDWCPYYGLYQARTVFFSLQVNLRTKDPV